MYLYLYYFVRLYPLFCYMFTMYRMFEYYSLAKKICNLFISAFYKAFMHAKDSEEIEEIYEMILTTDPNNTVLIDDTKYVKYYDEEDKKVKEDWFDEQKEGEITHV